MNWSDFYQVQDGVAKYGTERKVTSAICPHPFGLPPARLVSMRLFCGCYYKPITMPTCRDGARGRRRIRLSYRFKMHPSTGMTSIHRQPTMTAKLSKKQEQSSSNILFESVSDCVSPLSPGTPFPLRQRQEAKTYTSGQAQSWSLPLPRLANPGPRSPVRALAMSQDKAHF